ncbi:acyltransferase [Bacteroides sp. An51A]|uniref:acyltransferase n=1 Tax=Bacteroides sp. An51A TaxID=1965640 RepID=UPI00130228D9|nr:acyltransferase [Bacteroides sp. An51A]
MKWGGVKRFYNRRWKRLGIPLLVWNVLYMIMYFLSAYHNDKKLESLPELIEKFALFEYNGFMWFFVPLIMIYLSLPFFAVFILNSNRNLLRLFLIIGLFLGCIPPLDTDFTIREGLGNIYLMGSRFFYFIVAGYYVGHFDISVKTRRMIYTCSLICMLIMFCGTMLLTLYMPEHYRYFITYTNIPCIVSAIGVFTFFRYNDWNKLLNNLKLNKERLAYFSSFSLGIYLIQGAWFTILGFFHICDEHIIIKFFVMYALCVGSVWVMKHIPTVKRMVS